jgi:hypothetical protein
MVLDVVFIKVSCWGRTLTPQLEQKRSRELRARRRGSA